MDRSPVVHFGPFTFDRARMLLHREGLPVPIGGRAAALLTALINAQGQVVTRSELLEAAWPNQIVEEHNLTVQIAALRHTIGPLPNGEDPIRTVSRVGYSLLLNDPAPSAKNIVALRPNVAVLPFVNPCGDPELAMFADGVTGDIIASLARFQAFAVVARGSSFAYKDRPTQVPDVARMLGVSYVLEGSIRRQERRFRVAARLSAADGVVLWADCFEEELGGLFEIEDRITTKVMGHAEPQISRAELERSHLKHPESLDAYDHFIRGIACFCHLDTSAELYNRAVDHLDRAVQLDPTFPYALTGAAYAHEMRHTFGDASPPGVNDFAIAEDLADRALAIAPDDAMVLASTAMMIINHKDDGTMGLALADRAVTLSPHNYEVLKLAGMVQRQRGRSDEAIKLYERCLRLSPHSPKNAMIVENIGCCHLDRGRYGEAAEWVKRALTMGATWDLALVNLIVAEAMLGNGEAAHSALERLLRIRPSATIRKIMDRLPPGTRRSVEHIWPEGLRRAGLQEA